jgi:hypothetical protein
MTNMPAEPAPYWPFAITLVAICIPFFSIIGFLSTNYGYHMWATKTRQFWRWLRPKPDPEEEIEAEYTGIARKNRSMSTEEGMRMRIRNSLVRMGTLTEVDSETGSTGRTTRDTLINIQEPK